MSELLNLPRGHFVLQSSTATMPLQKAKFRVHKIYDSNKNSDYELAYDSKFKKVNFDSVLKKELILFNKQYGKLHPVLYHMLAAKERPKFLQVAVWLDIEHKEPMKTKLKTGQLKGGILPAAIREAREKRDRQVSEIESKIANAIQVKPLRRNRLAPVLLFKLTPDQIKQISNIKEVAALMLHDPKGIDDLQDSLNISHGQQVVYTDGNKAKDIPVAVWESGPDDETNLVISGRFKSSPSTSAHARLTHGIIKNKQANAPHGYAPSCKLFSANDKDTDALEWAVGDKDCRVISQSFHRSSEQTDGSLSSDDILKDYLVMNYPYPTIIQAAGNIVTGDGDTADEFVNHKGYNSMSVGNHNDTATAMSGDTTFRNPTSNHGDRELPELCANGTNVTAVGETMSGTSFAAPATAGSAAVLMGINSTLKSWPEGIRAILMAGSTRNVAGDNWRKDMINGIDAKDGAGALTLDESAGITRSRKAANNTASRRGWDVGKLESSDFRSDGFAKAVYKIKVPSRGPTHVKVALAWDSNAFRIWFLKFSILALDLDLRIYKGETLVASSSSWDNSYEVAEYDAKPGDELTVKIKRYSGSHWTYYGLAWTIF
jgi:hypothetical protein